MKVQSQDLVITTGMIHVTQTIDLMPGVIIHIRLIRNRKEFVRNQICYKFRDKGFCHYGNNCKYQHSPVVVSQFSDHSISGQHTREADQLSFLGEIRRLVNSVQNMVETHRVVYRMFHTGLQQSVAQTSQGHQIFPVVNQQPL